MSGLQIKCIVISNKIARFKTNYRTKNHRVFIFLGKTAHIQLLFQVENINWRLENSDYLCMNSNRYFWILISRLQVVILHFKSICSDLLIKKTIYICITRYFLLKRLQIKFYFIIGSHLHVNVQRNKIRFICNYYILMI